jgi:hypothetical protein
MIRKAVVNLARSLPSTDIRGLDHHLVSTAGYRAGSVTVARCRSRSFPRPGDAERLRVECGVPGDQVRASLSLLRLGTMVTEGEFIHLELGSRRYNPVAVMGGRIMPVGGKATRSARVVPHHQSAGESA